MANTRIISIRELPRAAPGEPNAGGAGAVATPDSLPKTRLIPMREGFAAREPAVASLPDLATGTSRANLRTTLVPVEHLLARRAPAPASAADESNAPPAPPSQATPAPRKRSIPPKRRILVAALVGALISSMAIAANVMGAARGTPAASQSNVQPARAAKSLSKPAAPAARRREPTPPTSKLTPHETGISLERAASDAVVEGRFADAAQVYERLAEAMPQRAVYREAARILRERGESR